jgi:hypothetical protein
MKTFKDLLELIATETELSNGKQMTMEFSIDTHYKWISFSQCHNLEGLGDTKIIKHESYKTEAQLQQIYWTIYNNGRFQHINK